MTIDLGYDDLTAYRACDHFATELRYFVLYVRYFVLYGSKAAAVVRPFAGGEESGFVLAAAQPLARIIVAWRRRQSLRAISKLTPPEEDAPKPAVTTVASAAR